jgi:D-alanyl-D-alanine carboxypeptidase (penicillin-binding protein 5/6)
VDYVTLVPAKSIIRYLPTDYDPDKLQIAYSTYAEALEAPIHEGTVYGTVAVSYDGEIVGTADLIATASVTRSEFLHVLKQIKDFTSGRFFRATVVFILLFSVAYVLFEAHRREMQMRRRF